MQRRKQQRELEGNRVKKDVVDCDEEDWSCLVCGKIYKNDGKDLFSSVGVSIALLIISNPGDFHL